MSRAVNNAGIFGKFSMLDLLRLNPSIVTAAGSNSQANATLLTTTYTVVASLSAITTRGIKAFAAVTGHLLIIKNTQTTNLKVYPFASSQLGTTAVNSAFSLGALKTGIWIARNRIKWDMVLTAS